jgi:hypothetical protein
MPRGNSSTIQKTIGPGTLYGAALGTTEPAATLPFPVWPTGWFQFGYTEDGSSFSYEVTTEPVEVAEELERVFTVTTGRNQSVSLQLAEPTQHNLKAALNGGVSAITDPTSGQAVVFEPPDLGTEVRIMLGFESESGLERWIWRQCFQTGTVEMQRRKGAQKVLIPVTFTVEKPESGLKSWVRMTDTTLKGGPAA